MQKYIQKFHQVVSPLLEYRSNVTSQCGEDGIIEHIMSVLNPVHRYCVEFGAADGKYFSNCYNLIRNRGWSGLMIEADPVKYQALTETYGEDQGVRTVNRLVDFDGRNTLDNILTEHEAPSEPGLISIDIDGNDYHVWDSLSAFRPELIVIEINPTIPNDVVFIQDKSFEVNHGCSLLALVMLGQTKGYELVACTDLNAFFVKKGKAALLGLENTSHFQMYTPMQDGRIFQGMDNSIHVVGMDRLIWDACRDLTFEDFQVVSGLDRMWGDAQGGAPGSFRTKALAHFQEGLSRHQAGDLAEAAALYGYATDLIPDFVESYSNRGTVLFSMGLLSEAAACHRRAIYFRPDSADFYCNLGVTLIQMGSFDEAERVLRRALDLVPDHFHAHFNLGIILSSSGRMDEAIPVFRQALAINPESTEAIAALEKARSATADRSENDRPRNTSQ